MRKLLNGIIRWLPSVLWMATIFTLSSRTGDEMNAWLPLFQRMIPGMKGFDWGHFIAYFVLALTFSWALHPRTYTWKARACIAAACLLYGLSDEIHQHFVVGRSPDWHDLRNDMIGAVLAMLWLAWRPVRRRFEHVANSIIF